MEKNQTNAASVTLHPFRQVIWRHIWKCTAEKRQTNATSVVMHPPMQAIWRHIRKHTAENHCDFTLSGNTIDPKFSTLLQSKLFYNTYGKHSTLVIRTNDQHFYVDILRQVFVKLLFLKLKIKRQLLERQKVPLDRCPFFRGLEKLQ